VLWQTCLGLSLKKSKISSLLLVLIRFFKKICVKSIAFTLVKIVSRYSSDDIATGYELDGQCSTLSGGKIFFFSPRPPDRLWCPSSLMSNGHRGLFP
jgi:hypothetical protein